MSDYIAMTLVLVGALCADGNFPLCAALIATAGVVSFWPSRSKKRKKDRPSVTSTRAAKVE